MTARVRTPAILGCLAIATVLSGSLAACGDDDNRPRRAAWEREWEETQAVIPAAAAFGDDPEDRCGEILGEVRARREEMMPTPNQVVDEAFRDWVKKAEALGLDCADDTEDLEKQIEELEDLADAVDGALAGAP